MTVVLAARAPLTFEIKSAQLPLVALLLKTTRLDMLTRELDERFADLPEFFDHDPVVIDFTPVADTADVVDVAALVPLLRRWRMAPVAARGGNPQQMAAALAAGLAAGNDARMLPVMAATVAPDVAPVAAAPVPALGSLLVEKPVRSGQQIYARGRDLVLLAMVNPGAEVIADGHIHVYAPLRGKAIAGARGNADARILSLCLDAEMLSIAGTYRTSETPLPAQVRGQPAQVRLAGDTLVMDLLGN